MQNIDRLLQALTNAIPQGDYARGVHDLLRLLALLDDDHLPTGRTAQMVLAVLRAHLQDGTPLHVDWNDLDADGLRGADVLRWVEAARLHHAEAPTPARRADAVGVVIKRGDGRYLMEYDEHGGMYQPFGGKIERSDPTPEDALRRELYEELHLDDVPGPEVARLRELPGYHSETILSPTYGIYTAYTFRFFFAERLTFPIKWGGWVTRAEMMAGAAADGRAISDVYGKALGWAALDGLPATELGA
jgi:8-oxo-dGTP pyrophosphatase MutT (NUDIX family)